MTPQRASMRRPLELTMAVRNVATLPQEVTRAIAYEAISAQPATVLMWRQAAFASAVAEQAAILADVLLRSPHVLQAALAAVEAGEPLTARKVGIDAEAILSAAGRAIHHAPLDSPA